MELALLLAVVVAVFSGMALYVRRSLQARYRDGVKYPFAKIEAEARTQGVSGLTNLGRQYQPTYTEQEMIEIKDKDDRSGGSAGSSIDASSSRKGWQKVNVPD